MEEVLSNTTSTAVWRALESPSVAPLIDSLIGWEEDEVVKKDLQLFLRCLYVWIVFFLLKNRNYQQLSGLQRIHVVFF